MRKEKEMLEEIKKLLRQRNKEKGLLLRRIRRDYRLFTREGGTKGVR